MKENRQCETCTHDEETRGFKLVRVSVDVRNSSVGACYGRDICPECLEEIKFFMKENGKTKFMDPENKLHMYVEVTLLKHVKKNDEIELKELQKCWMHEGFAEYLVQYMTLKRLPCRLNPGRGPIGG